MKEGRGQRNKQDVKGEREEKRILCCLVGNRIRIIASIRFSQQIHVEIVFALLLLWMKVYL